MSVKHPYIKFQQNGIFAIPFYIYTNAFNSEKNLEKYYCQL